MGGHLHTLQKKVFWAMGHSPVLMPGNPCLPIGFDSSPHAVAAAFNCLFVRLLTVKAIIQSVLWVTHPVVMVCFERYVIGFSSDRLQACICRVATWSAFSF